LREQWKALVKTGTGHFGLVFLSLMTQSWVGLAAFGASLLIIRFLSPQEYAFYTLAASFLAMMGIFGDLGLTVGVNSIGGAALREGKNAEAVLGAAVRMRWTNVLVAGAVLGPVHGWLLARHGASWLVIVMLLGAALLGCVANVKLALMSCYLRLTDRHRTAYSIDAQGAALRPLALAAASFAGLTAVAVVALNSLASVIIARLYERRLPRLMVPALDDASSLRRKLRKLTLQLAPSAAFQSVQGQLYIWLIAIFGSTQSVAEVGALSRLAMVVTVLTGGVSSALAPKFARMNGVGRVAAAYLLLTLGLAAALLSILAFSYFFPQFFRMLLGQAFLGSNYDLVLAVAAQCVGGMSAFMFSLNAARGWVRRLWWNIPLTLAVQAIGVASLPLGSTSGVLTFLLVTCVPGLVLNFLLFLEGMAALKHHPASKD
jgi:O-antigen/teichoic acid export membrane protein